MAGCHRSVAGRRLAGRQGEGDTMLSWPQMVLLITGVILVVSAALMLIAATAAGKEPVSPESAFPRGAASMNTWSRSLLVLTLLVFFGVTWSLCAGRPTRATMSMIDPSLVKLRTEIARFQRNPCESRLEFVQGEERWYLTCEDCGIAPADWVFARLLLEVVGGTGYGWTARGDGAGAGDSGVSWGASVTVD